MSDFASQHTANEEVCLNCNHSTAGAYCSHCGQKHGPALLSVKSVLNDALEHLFHPLDSRLYKTLKTLVVNPGKLTKEYVRGRRKMFTSPLRLYLLITFVYFFVVNIALSRIPQVTSSGEAAVVLDMMPKVTFFMVPVLALILKGFYSKHLYVAHLIFSLHFHCFAFLLLTLNGLSPFVSFPGATPTISPATILLAVVSIALQLAVLVYLIFSVRNVYNDSTSKAALKTLPVLFIYLGILTAVVMSLVNLSKWLG